MKKIEKRPRLVLSKERIRELQAPKLADVAGARAGGGTTPACTISEEWVCTLG